MMADQIRKSVVGSNGNLPYDCSEDVKTAITIHTNVRLREIAAQLAELNGKSSSFADQPVKPLVQVHSTTMNLKSKTTENWSPTQEQINAYVDSIEYELTRKCAPIQHTQVTRRGLGVGSKPRNSNLSAPFYWAVAVLIASLAWLLHIICE
jgi:hypothetical protein